MQNVGIILHFQEKVPSLFWAFEIRTFLREKHIAIIQSKLAIFWPFYTAFSLKREHNDKVHQEAEYFLVFQFRTFWNEGRLSRKCCLLVKYLGSIDGTITKIKLLCINLNLSQQRFLFTDDDDGRKDKLQFYF